MTIGLGLGGCLAIIALLHQGLLAALPFHDASRLVVLQNTGKYYFEGRIPEGLASPRLSGPDFEDLRAQARSLSDIGGAVTYSGFMRGGERPRPVSRVLVTSKLFPLLAPRPRLGRLLNEGDFAAGATPAAMVTESMWRGHFGADPEIAGRTIHLDDQPFTVVGVLSDASLAFLRQPSGVLDETRDVSVISPFLAEMAGGEARMVTYSGQHRDAPSLAVLGRIAPGRTLADVETEMKLVAGRLAREHPGANKGRGLHAQAFEDWRIAEVRGTVNILLAAAVLVFFVACLNATGLVLADSVRRETDRAVRQALGAGFSRLVATELVRSVVMVLPGGLLAIALAAFTLLVVDRTVAGGSGGMVRALLIPRVVVAAFLYTLVAGLLAGAGAAWSIRRHGVAEALKEGGPTASIGRRRHLVMRAFVALQVAAATALVIGAGLMLRSVWNIVAVDLGFDVRQNLVVEMRLPPSRYPKGADHRSFTQSALRRVRALPGVTAAGVAIAPPLTGASQLLSGLEIVTPQGTPRTLDRVENQSVTTGYLEALGMKLVRGRWFNEADADDPSGAAVVDRSFCDKYLAGTDPLTSRLRFNRRLIPIVGVAGDVRPSGPLGKVQPMLYMLERFDRPTRWSYMVVRADGRPGDLGQQVLREVLTLDPEVSIGDPRTVHQLFAATFATRRRLLALLGGAAVLVLLLTAFSLVSSLAQFIAGRRRDIAIRLALGAGRSQVAGLLARHVGVALAFGMTLGALAGVALAWTLSSELFGLLPTDRTTFVGSLVVMASLAALTAAVPAWRASRIDPARTLRAQ